MKEEISFNDIPRVLGELLDKVDELIGQNEQLRQQVAKVTSLSDTGLRPGIYYRICDKRLFTGPGAPFRSYSSIYNAINKGLLQSHQGLDGHRCITLADIEAYRTGNAPKLDSSDWIDTSKI